MCTIGASVLLKTVWLMSPNSKKIDARRSADAYWEKWLAHSGRTSSGSRCRVFRLRSDLKHGAAGVPSLSALPARCRRPSG